MADTLTILLVIWVLVVYVIGLFLGTLRGKKLNDEEFENLKQAYYQVERALGQTSDKAEITRLTRLMRGLEDIAKRRGWDLEPREPALPTT